MRRYLARVVWLGLWIASPASAQPPEPTTGLPTAVSLAAGATPEEDPNDPTTMASLHRAFFIPDTGATALAGLALVAGLGLGWLWRRRVG